jgi:1-acyl-sn-glycerol-3-phosphate acyltransferase
LIRRLARLLYRLTAALAIGVAGLGLLVLILPLRAQSLQRWLAARREAMRLWTGALCRVLGVQIERTGTVPDRPFFLVSNHLTYLDILVLGHECPARFVGKAELRHWPLVGWLCRGAGVIFIDRSSRRDVVRVGGEIERTFEEREGVVVFPEGTSTRGHEVAPFKPPVLAWPSMRGLPVHAVTLSYRLADDQPPADQVVAWWGGMTFVPHLLRLLQLPRIEARVHFDPEPIVDEDRKRLAERLRAKVASHFEPLVDLPEPVAEPGQ